MSIRLLHIEDLNMKFVGIDIAKSKFDVCIKGVDFDTSTFFSLPNNLKGFETLISLLAVHCENSDFHLGFESTSTYMMPLQQYIEGNGITYTVVNTLSLSHFIKYNNLQNKTDKRDSYYIALYLENFKDTNISSSINQFRNYFKMYNTSISLLKKMEVQLKGLNDSLSFNTDSDSIHSQMFSLQTYIEKTHSDLTKQMTLSIREHIPYFDNIKNDLVGVSDKTLLVVLPVIFDISDKYTIKQLQSFIGLNPIYTQSGSSINKKQYISKRGDVNVRKALYMSAVSSIRFNPLLRDKYLRLLANGKPKKLAMVAISAHIFRAIVSKLNHYKSLHECDNDSH